VSNGLSQKQQDIGWEKLIFGIVLLSQKFSRSSRSTLINKILRMGGFSFYLHNKDIIVNLRGPHFIEIHQNLHLVKQ
jgi:hypothetical protein